MGKDLREGGGGAEGKEAKEAILLQKGAGGTRGPQEGFLREWGQEVGRATAGFQLGEEAAGGAGVGAKQVQSVGEDGARGGENGGGKRRGNEERT